MYILYCKSIFWHSSVFTCYGRNKNQWSILTLIIVTVTYLTVYCVVQRDFILLRIVSGDIPANRESPYKTCVAFCILQFAQRLLCIVTQRVLFLLPAMGFCIYLNQARDGLQKLRFAFNKWRGHRNSYLYLQNTVETLPNYSSTATAGHTRDWIIYAHYCISFSYKKL